MYFTDAKDAHYKAGVPRDVQTFYSKLGGIKCPECDSMAGFSTLNELTDWSDNQNPCRCTSCQHEWNDI